MSRQDKRFSRGLFRTLPEDGARLAEFAEGVIPGGRGFVRQLFRAKREVLEGVSHLIEGQLEELKHVDVAIQDKARQESAPAESGSARQVTQPPAREGRPDNRSGPKAPEKIAVG